MKENIVVSFSLRNLGIKFLLVSLKSINVGRREMGGGRGPNAPPLHGQKKLTKEI